MALIQCNCFSETLRMSVQFTAILPQPTRAQIGMLGQAGTGPHPTLYLLHGLSDDHTIWTRRTSIERYAAALGLAVVMPSAGRSFYMDTCSDQRYWSFVSEELPELARSFFPLSARREDNFVAGLSMGGYGALKLGLRCPEKFAAVASLSGVLDIAGWVGRVREGKSSLSMAELRGLMGPELIVTPENDLLRLLAAAVEKDGGASLPKFFLTCGMEDFLYEDNLRFLGIARRLGLDEKKFAARVTVPGAHEWGYWDREIQHVLSWLPLPRDRT